MTNDVSPERIAARIRKLTDTAAHYALLEHPRVMQSIPTTMEIALSHFRDLANEIERSVLTADAPAILAARIKGLREFLDIADFVYGWVEFVNSVRARITALQSELEKTNVNRD